MTTILLLGFEIGLRHELEADHVAAVATLSSPTRTLSEAIPVGIMWGLGHTLTLFVFAGLVMMSGNMVSDTIAGWLEVAVGVMLVLLGGDFIRRLVRDRIHFHTHKHTDGDVHIHAHSHKGQRRHGDAQHRHEHPRAMSFRALFVGMMHGLAGSAALVLLTVGTVGEPMTGFAYIGLFGLGSIVGMAVLSVIIAVPLRYTANNMTWAYTSLTMVMGLFSIGLGGFTIYSSGIV